MERRKRGYQQLLLPLSLSLSLSRFIVTRGVHTMSLFHVFVQCLAVYRCTNGKFMANQLRAVTENFPSPVVSINVSLKIVVDLFKCRRWGPPLTMFRHQLSFLLGERDERHLVKQNILIFGKHFFWSLSFIGCSKCLLRVSFPRMLVLTVFFVSRIMNYEIFGRPLHSVKSLGDFDSSPTYNRH